MNCVMNCLQTWSLAFVCIRNPNASAIQYLWKNKEQDPYITMLDDIEGNFFGQ